MWSASNVGGGLLSAPSSDTVFHSQHAGDNGDACQPGTAADYREGCADSHIPSEGELRPGTRREGAGVRAGRAGRGREGRQVSAYLPPGCGAREEPAATHHVTQSLRGVG